MAAEKILRIDPKDNVLVALTQLPAGEAITFAGEQYVPLSEYRPSKNLPCAISPQVTESSCMAELSESCVRQSLVEACLARVMCSMTPPASGPRSAIMWSAPRVSHWSERTFAGYHRADGQVGTRNYWLVIPLVFCENRNVEALRDAFEEELGYGRPKLYRQQVRHLIEQHNQALRSTQRDDLTLGRQEQVFPNVDGVRFLVHEGGCGGTRQDSKALCGLLASYIHHPNCRCDGAESSCQNAQPSILMDALRERIEICVSRF